MASFGQGLNAGATLYHIRKHKPTDYLKMFNRANESYIVKYCISVD